MGGRVVVDGCFLCLSVFLIVVLCLVLFLFLSIYLFLFLRLVRGRFLLRRLVLRFLPCPLPLPLPRAVGVPLSTFEYRMCAIWYLEVGLVFF